MCGCVKRLIIYARSTQLAHRLCDVAQPAMVSRAYIMSCGRKLMFHLPDFGGVWWEF